ncbi:hypothetical protein HPB48_021828 [Haemaphysalis longicornis]|uniref:G2/mitotic-specific cyclin-B3 n=1 Tax=Haemaphysalis longicornis TaxID=44386 RepID=A0A9J6FW89_HAELO|nr:hypothetical protein HPB48_021828 [Haemaphysalis longicornis]
MTGRDAGDRFFDDDENRRTPNKIPQQPEKAEGFAQDAVPNRKALRDSPLNAAPHPSPRRDWRKRETAPTSRSLGLPESFENSFSLSDLDELEDSSDDAPTKNAKANAHDGPGPASTQYATCKGDDASIISAGGPENGTASAPIHSLPDFQKAEGEPDDALNAAIRTLDMICYTEIREKDRSELYWQDVYNHLRNREQELLPDPLCMHRKPHIASYMRSDLVDWLVALADEYSLYDEKLFLAVSYIDRFLSLMSVQRNCLQLLGTAALLTAFKFGEGDQRRCSDLLCASGNIYTKDDMLCMERKMLKVFIYGICAPTVYYLRRPFMEVSKAPAGLRLLAQYFCELALLDDDPYLQFPPSVIAVAAVCLVRRAFGRQPWGRETAEYSVYHFWPAAMRPLSTPGTRLPISRRASPAFTQALLTRPAARRKPSETS